MSQMVYAFFPGEVRLTSFRFENQHNMPNVCIPLPTHRHAHTHTQKHTDTHTQTYACMHTHKGTWRHAGKIYHTVFKGKECQLLQCLRVSLTVQQAITLLSSQHRMAQCPNIWLAAAAAQLVRKPWRHGSETRAPLLTSKLGLQILNSSPSPSHSPSLSLPPPPGLTTLQQ